MPIKHSRIKLFLIHFSQMKHGFNRFSFFRRIIYYWNHFLDDFTWKYIYLDVTMWSKQVFVDLWYAIVLMSYIVISYYLIFSHNELMCEPVLPNVL